ncbi:DUF3369 domain-containing protein, partial [Pseudorhodoferax sp. Leaf267]|uniref:DUF3369 domain-containing protein n=1 Tax=Pseudorhodoferax sp. Leaf267 TaxID=1736316 RepID=UPI001F40A97F
MAHVRIVLRTGQPGHAPEIETIQRYDINDYKTKSDLTRVKLYTALTSAVRSYEQLRRLEDSRRGLEKIIEASNQLLAAQGLRGFADGVVIQVASLIGVPPEGLVCAAQRQAAGTGTADGVVIGAAGAFTGLVDRSIDALPDPQVTAQLRRALAEQRHLLEPGQLTLFFAGHEGHDFAAFVRADAPLREVDARLLEVFCTNIALSASNLDLLARLRQHAFVDRLLGLPNRTAMIRHVSEAGSDGHAADHVLALLDIDQFAETNDMFGHVYGDQLLEAIARRLTDGLPAACFLARVAGDTFGVWGSAAAVQPARLAALLQQPFEITGVARPVSFSMGFVRWEQDTAGGQELYKNASIALKQAKAGGQGGAQYYTAEVGSATRERTRLLHGLQQAFNRDRLFVVYQPQLALGTGRAVGAEALLRWRTDEGRFVSPAQFIPVAEQSGLIVPIGQWVLRTALRAAARLRDAGTPLRMAVNVSPLQFAQPQFLAEVDQALADARLPPDCL